MNHKRLGLTGSIGAGKTTVATLLQQKGFTVLDADAIAREATTQPEVLEQIKLTFGPQYVNEHGLDRAALAELVFHNRKHLQKLNGIIHPYVRKRINELEQQATSRWVVQDIPLLFENNLDAQMDATLLVDAPLEIRIQRVTHRDNITREQVIARDAAQMPSDEKRRRASITLINDGDVRQLKIQLETALEALGVTP